MINVEQVVKDYLKSELLKYSETLIKQESEKFAVELSKKSKEIIGYIMNEVLVKLSKDPIGMKDIIEIQATSRITTGGSLDET